MAKKGIGIGAVLVAGFVAGFLVRGLTPDAPVFAQSGQVYELRTYTTNEAKLGDLNARFRNHTMRLFTKHGMTNVAYFVPQDAPASQNTLVYLIAHASREQAKKNWAAFGGDPEWQKVAKESQVNGQILAKAPESVFLNATDYSPMK
jgi:hypothetical protein